MKSYSYLVKCIYSYAGLNLLSVTSVKKVYNYNSINLATSIIGSISLANCDEPETLSCIPQYMHVSTST